MHNHSLTSITADELEAFLAHLARDHVLSGCGDIEILWSHLVSPVVRASPNTGIPPAAASIGQLLAVWMHERAKARS